MEIFKSSTTSVVQTSHTNKKRVLYNVKQTTLAISHRARLTPYNTTSHSSLPSTTPPPKLLTPQAIRPLLNLRLINPPPNLRIFSLLPHFHTIQPSCPRPRVPIPPQTPRPLFRSRPRHTRISLRPRARFVPPPKIPSLVLDTHFRRVSLMPRFRIAICGGGTFVGV